MKQISSRTWHFLPPLATSWFLCTRSCCSQVRPDCLVCTAKQFSLPPLRRHHSDRDPLPPNSLSMTKRVTSAVSQSHRTMPCALRDRATVLPIILARLAVSAKTNTTVTQRVRSSNAPLSNRARSPQLTGRRMISLMARRPRGPWPRRFANNSLIFSDTWSPHDLQRWAPASGHLQPAADVWLPPPRRTETGTVAYFFGE